jgi:hypothetical protein
MEPLVLSSGNEGAPAGAHRAVRGCTGAAFRQWSFVQLMDLLRRRCISQQQELFGYSRQNLEAVPQVHVPPRIQRPLDGMILAVRAWNEGEVVISTYGIKNGRELELQRSHETYNRIAAPRLHLGLRVA